MMYTQGHFPTASTMQEDEIAYQVRRLAHHPSIAIWDACSEYALALPPYHKHTPSQ
jgi:beta-galactosidase/beta-glucuronidase